MSCCSRWSFTCNYFNLSIIVCKIVYCFITCFNSRLSKFQRTIRINSCRFVPFYIYCCLTSWAINRWTNSGTHSDSSSCICCIISTRNSKFSGISQHSCSRSHHSNRTIWSYCNFPSISVSSCSCSCNIHSYIFSSCYINIFLINNISDICISTYIVFSCAYINISIVSYCWSSFSRSYTYRFLCITSRILFIIQPFSTSIVASEVLWVICYVDISSICHRSCTFCVHTIWLTTSNIYCTRIISMIHITLSDNSHRLIA